MKIFLSLSLLIAFALSPVEGKAQSQQTKPRSSRSSTVYPDLFRSLLDKTEQQVKVKIDSAFDQLFFGNDSTQRVYFPAADDMAYIEDIANHDVRTEGMSYGMMIAVQKDNKKVFDSLWKWATTYMQFKDGPHKRYFAWHCRPDGAVLDSNSASDGEQWFAMSLFLASGRWGNGSGIYDYRQEAQDILNTMLHKEEQPDHGSVTDMFNRKNKLVVFVPSERADGFTDPSYMLPHFYELWSVWADNDNMFWREAADSSRELLHRAANRETGLCPDYSNFDGTPVVSWYGGHNDFRFDAWRVAMNVAMDYEWSGLTEKSEVGSQPARRSPPSADERGKSETGVVPWQAWEISECNKLLNFFMSQGIDNYGNQYTLDGKELGKDHSTGLVAMNAVAAIASTSANRKDFVQALWNAEIPHGHYRYYDGMLYMLGLLQASGNFRIYSPGVESGSK